MLAIVAIATFSFLGSHGLYEPDEGRYAEVAREMSLQQNWLIPHLAGVPHLTKPPLTYWLTAWCIRWLGANEWAARLPSALSGLGTIAVTMHLARLLYDRSTGLTAGMILASSALFGAMSRVLTTDMLLTFFITASITAFIHYERRRNAFALLLFYLCLGAGFLTKGPMAYFVPLAALVPWIVFRRKHARAPSPGWHWIPGLALSAAIGLSWFIALYRHDAHTLAYFLREEMFKRVATDAHHRAKPLWYYTVTTLAGFFPWSVIAPRLTWDLWKKHARPKTDESWLLAGWIIVPWVLLHAITSKLPSYTLPLYPAMAIVLAHAIGQSSHRWISEARWIMVAAGTAIASMPILLCVYGGAVGIPLKPDILYTVMAMVMGILWIAGYVGTNDAGSGRILVSWMFMLMLASMVFLSWRVGSFISAKNKSMDNVARDISAYISGHPDTVIIATHMKKFGLEFYLQRPLVRSLRSRESPMPIPGDIKHLFMENPLEYANLHPGSSLVIVIPEFFLPATIPSDWIPVQSYHEMKIYARPGAVAGGGVP